MKACWVCRYDAERAGRSVLSRDVRRVAWLAGPVEMPGLRQTGDQPLAPLPHTHRPKVPLPLLPGHLQQDRHPTLAHTHQAQGDSVRQRVLVEDADRPAEEAAAGASAAPPLRRQAHRAFLRIRTALTKPRPTAATVRPLTSRGLGTSPRCPANLPRSLTPLSLSLDAARRGSFRRRVPKRPSCPRSDACRFPGELGSSRKQSGNERSLRFPWDPVFPNSTLCWGWY